MFPIEKMCKTLKVSRSAYYGWLSRKPSKRDIDNEYLNQKIREIYHDSKRTYGSPRITLALRGQGIRVSRNRVARIMKKENLKSIIRKKFVVTTD
jgi:putative transposase